MVEGTAAHLWMSWTTFCLLAAGVTLTSETLRLCPPTCRCNITTLEVNCSSGQLTSIPSGLPYESKLLNLTHNMIKTLVHQQFHNLTQLLHLDVSDNLLTLVEVEAFLGLHSLLTLRVPRNRLEVISVGVFAGLRNLQLLDISSNKILVLLDFTFRDLASLEFFAADGNDFVFISPQAFTGLSSLKKLELDGRNLTAVPTEALAQLSELRSFHLHQLDLTTLPNYSFRSQVRLKELVISHFSRLKTLSGNSLFGLNLTSLTIQHCNLSDVPYTPLHPLVYLIYLDLSFNPITCIQGNLLGDLLRLQEFRLVGGSLTCIEGGAFKGLAHLKVLNVSTNRLTTLEVESFHSVETLKTLGLSNNPLACDCRLLWVVQRQQYMEFDGQPPVCSASVQLQGWSFLDFPENELSHLLTCRLPQILNPKSQQVRVDQGRTAAFHCSAEGDPQPSVSWLNPQLRHISTTGRIRALSNGSLEVRYAQPLDSGTYICVASNAAGNNSLPFKLSVQALPSSSISLFRPKSWSASPSASPGEAQKLPIDMKTLLIAATIGFFSFFSSVTVCFIFMFFWSKGKGQIKHTATIAYVPRSAVSNNNTRTGNYKEPGRFTMKLI
ncbi:leucine-rich repeat and immunoglobulin-like domain-containing nogo receptor-interacting protein 1 [Nematolebias whitei]|uniref:leucine-rich repeat and immunoglobulin-like domain-containing nogo receptor-interacting protein 1 n=1 Tax=Nematolebias whitei TaxID=451745 RepID=UPI001897AC6D|nr:leucine-rich repeat and immunoglobulin-like domain-containing nogo receptor-interacting protein 1 [Nematolebias whitei]